MVTRMADCASTPLTSTLPLLAFLVADKRFNWHAQEDQPLPTWHQVSSVLMGLALISATSCSSPPAQLSRDAMIDCIQFLCLGWVLCEGVHVQVHLGVYVCMHLCGSVYGRYRTTLCVDT